MIPPIVYIIKVYVFGIVKNVRWWWNDFKEEYLLLLDVVDVKLKGTLDQLNNQIDSAILTDEELQRKLAEDKGRGNGKRFL